LRETTQCLTLYHGELILGILGYTDKLRDQSDSLSSILLHISE